MAPLSASKPARIGPCRNAWALPEVCKLVRHEVLPLMPKVSELYFEIYQSKNPGAAERPLIHAWHESDTWRMLRRAKRANFTFVDEDGKHLGECTEHDCKMYARQTVSMQPELLLTRVFTIAVSLW